MPLSRRKTLLVIGATLALAVLGTGALALSFWWPDSTKLAGFAARGDLDGVRLCLRLGVDPDQPERWGWGRAYDGQTPLTAAAQFGRVEVIRLLLEAGADPNLRDAGPEYPHETPLSTAAMHGQLEACRVLLDAGADPNIPTNPGSGSAAPGGWTALDWALQAEQAEVAALLRQQGAIEGRRGSK